MFKELAAKDRELFDSVFNTCDTDKLAQLLTDDFEFYHDKDGQSANSAAVFVKDVKDMCERQKQGTDYRARRELVKTACAFTRSTITARFRWASIVFTN